MSEEMVPIGIDDVLSFNCSPDVSCFNECCRDLNQFLTPYDILRLKNCLGMPSDIFLRKYTSRHSGPESGLPVITFKADPHSGHACPFVTEKGCSVYADRPASCRIYPLARAITRSRDTGKITEHFALIEDPRCQGFGRKREQHAGEQCIKEQCIKEQYVKEQHDKEKCLKEQYTKEQYTKEQCVREWLNDQDVDLHNEMNDKLMEIISLKNRIMPGKLDGIDADHFYLACYDLDTFRKEIFEKGLLDEVDIPSSFLETVKIDDATLLELGLDWIKHTFFGLDMLLDKACFNSEEPGLT